MEVKNLIRAVPDWSFQKQILAEDKRKNLPPSLNNRGWEREKVRMRMPVLPLRHVDDPGYVLPPNAFLVYDREVKQAYNDWININGYCGYRDWYNVYGKAYAKKHIQAYRNQQAAQVVNNPFPAAPEPFVNVEHIEEPEEFEAELGDNF